MRIQLICAFFPPFGTGGGPVTSELIARGLVAAGHEVEVVTASDTPLDERRDGYRVLSIGSPNIYADYHVRRPAWKRAIWHVVENFNPRAYWRIRRAIRAFSPDIVATVSIENVNVATWLAAKRRGLPVVHFLHSYFLLCWRAALFKNGARCAGRCADCKVFSAGKVRMARHVDHVVGESRAVIDKHRAHGMFLDATPFVVPTPATDRDTVAEPRAGRPTVTIGFIGALTVEKGVETLADAARTLVARHGDAVRFLIAGKGDPALVAALQARFPAEATRFLGWADPADFYAEVDVVVVPSIWDEPYGRVSVEPLGHGIPVVVARSGGLVENVEDGVSGIVFSPGDADDLARVLGGLIDDRGRLRTLSQGAAARAGAYTFPVFADRLDQMMRTVASRAPVRHNRRRAAALEGQA